MKIKYDFTYMYKFIIYLNYYYFTGCWAKLCGCRFDFNFSRRVSR